MSTRRVAEVGRMSLAEILEANAGVRTGPSVPWWTLLTGTEHLQPLSQEIADLLELEFLGATPSRGSTINMGGEDLNLAPREQFVADFLLKVSRGGTDKNLRFTDVRVTFGPGEFAEPLGQIPVATRTFQEVTSSDPQRFGVTFLTKKANPYSRWPGPGNETFAQAMVCGTFDPSPLYSVRADYSFATEIDPPIET